MLCEGRLLIMTFGELEELDPAPPQRGYGSTRSTLSIHQSPLEQTLESRSLSVDCVSMLQAPSFFRTSPGKQISPKIKIPAQAQSDGDVPFLVPSFCQSICQNYSDLHIGGDHVLPLSATDGELRLCADAQAVGPFLESCDVPPAVEESLLGQPAQNGILHLNHWRQGSGRDRSFVLQGHEGPLPNSLLNHYLEQKLLDLYQQYMVENMIRERTPGSGSDPGSIYPLLGSEMFLTSLDQITMQVSRERNLEAGVAKDIILSCLLRVAGDMQSSEISTPFLQISNEASGKQLTENKEE